MRLRVLLGDAREVLGRMAADSVDAVVTDPPAGIAMMGKSWDNPWEYDITGHGFTDGANRVKSPAFTSARNPMCRSCHQHKRGDKHNRPCGCDQPDFDDGDRNREARDRFIRTMADIFIEVRRVLRPGGHALVWALPRTSHWTGMALEEAGFEVRDNIASLVPGVLQIFGSGFPKGRRVDMDERFCHCDASDDTSSGTSPVLLPADRKRKELDEDVAEDEDANALSGKNRVLDSQDGCQPDLRSDDGLPLLAQVDGPTSLPSQGCAQAHSHSFGSGDDPVSAPLHSPCRVQHSGHPSNRDCSAPTGAAAPEQPCTLSSRPHPDRTDSGDVSLGHRRLCSDESLSASPSSLAPGFPHCNTCGKPIAKGWNVALKPSYEFWWLVRKPLRESSVAANVLRWGTGGLNIAASRVATAERPLRLAENHDLRRGTYEGGAATQGGSRAVGTTTQGRWPPNCSLSHAEGCRRVGTRRVRATEPGTTRTRALGVLNDDAWQPKPTARPGYADPDGTEIVEAFECVAGCPVAELDRQSGTSISPPSVTRGARRQQAFGMGRQDDIDCYGDEGGASRFFPAFQPDQDDFVPFRYVAKADRAEREEGLYGLPAVTHRSGLGGEMPVDDEGNSRDRESVSARNHHPCVKSLSLCRWLIQLICPPDGTILDPFMGSGSTGCAAAQLGFNFIGIEQDPTYHEIAVARIRHWAGLFGQVETEEATE